MAGFAILTAVTCLVAYPQMFSGFARYDDEGYLLISLKSFLSHGSLYDDVFSQYGPFYYEVWGGVFSVLGAAVTHDNGRVATLVAWILASLTVGGATARITGSVLLGLATQMLVFAALVSLTREPMHPGGLICVLLGVVLLTATFVWGPAARRGMAVLGAALAALLLVKVNVGTFALAAVLLVCSVSYPALAGRRWIPALMGAGFVITPVVLMAGMLDHAWVREYCAHVTVAALLVVLALRSRPPEPSRDSGELRWLAAGLLLTGVAICVVPLASGTTPGELFEGVIRRPLGQPGAFEIPFDPANVVLLLDLLAIAGACLYLWLARSGRLTPGGIWVALVSLASIATGIEMALSVIGRPLPVHASATELGGYQLGFLAYAWVALIPIPGVAASGRLELARRLLPALAVLQALHAYPVAGSQLPWSAFLLVPVGALCISNGVRGVAQAIDGAERRRLIAALGATAGVALALFVADTTLRRPLEQARDSFDAATPLDLPGAHMMRVSPLQAEQYRHMSRELKRHCETFVSMPGLNSFYLWSGEDPPTGLNVTHWMTLFSDDDERRVVAAAGSVPRLCALEQPGLVEFWLRGEEVPQGPLVRFINDNFELFTQVGAYRLLRRAHGSGGSM